MNIHIYIYISTKIKHLIWQSVRGVATPFNITCDCVCSMKTMCCLTSPVSRALARQNARSTLEEIEHVSQIRISFNFQKTVERQQQYTAYITLFKLSGNNISTEHISDGCQWSLLFFLAFFTEKSNFWVWKFLGCCHIFR